MSRAFLPHVITDDSSLGGLVIERSLRFNDGDSANLTRTSSSASTTFTYSAWIKRTHFSGYQSIFSAGVQSFSFFTNSNTFYLYDGSTSHQSTAKFKDSIAWYHIVVQINSGTATSYINGDLVHNAVGSGAFTLTTGSNETRIGSQVGTYYFDGYMTEINLVDGSVVAPTEFGFTDTQTGIWTPKRYEGAYGTNGFHLDFSDNSSTAALGIDKSPNGNDFTANNFSVTAGKDDDSMIDTPTNNFPTFNLSNRSSGPTLSNGNLRMYYNYKPASKTTRTTFRFPKSGKYYYEWQNEESSSNPGRWQSGIINVVNETSTNYDIQGYNDADIVSYSYGGSTWFGTTHTSVSWDGTTRTWYSPERAAWAVDCDTGNVWVGRVASDGTTQWWAPDGSATGNPSKFLNPTGQIDKDKTHEYLPFMSWHDGGSASSTAFACNINFGQHSFLGTIPDGFKTLSSANIPPDPTINKIVRPQKHFDTVLWTGNSSSSNRSITGLEFKPDLVWSKTRNHGYHNVLMDSVRGASNRLNSDQSYTENFTNGGYLASFDDNGFTWQYGGGSNNEWWNESKNYVAWCWKGGGTAVSNTDGDITSSVSVNEEAGFSIATYTGSTASGALTVGHGLGKKPAWVMVKRRDSTGEWIVGHQALATDAFANNKFLKLDSSSSTFTNSLVWGAEPTTTVTQIVSDGNAGASNLTSSGTYVMYSWAEIPGYSRFGTYTGNGSSSGPYVYLGFRPNWVLVKGNSFAGNWNLFDIRRPGYNTTNDRLFPNLADAETDGSSSNNQIDIVSNGFILSGSNVDTNASGSTYIYMAFAEQPGTTTFDTFPNAR